MSAESMAIVLQHSRATGTDKVVLLGIANHDGDGGAWPTIATLSRYANVSVRNVKKSLARLVELRELSIETNGGGNRDTVDHRRPNLYKILLTCPLDCDRTKFHRTRRWTQTPLLDRSIRQAVERVSQTTPGVGSDTPPGVGSDTPPGVGSDTLSNTREVTRDNPSPVSTEATDRAREPDVDPRRGPAPGSGQCTVCGELTRHHEYGRCAICGQDRLLHGIKCEQCRRVIPSTSDARASALASMRASLRHDDEAATS